MLAMNLTLTSYVFAFRVLQTRYLTKARRWSWNQTQEAMAGLADPVQPYGSDPVFNRDSNIYRIDLYNDEGDFYNVSSADELNFQGVPRAFFPGEVNGPDADGFPVTISTTVLAERAAELMTALRDGRFLDWQTKSLDIRVMACNPNLQMMAFSTMRFEWEEGGTITFTAAPPRTANLDVGVTPRNVLVLMAFSVLALVLGELAGFPNQIRRLIRSLFQMISSMISALGHLFTSGRIPRRKKQPSEKRLRNLTYGDVMELVILMCLVAGVICHSLALAIASQATLTAKFPIYDAPQRSGARFFFPLRGEVPVTDDKAEGNGALDSSVGVGTSSSSGDDDPYEHRWQLPIDTSGADALSTLVATMSQAVYMSDVGYFFHSSTLFLAILRLLGRWSFQPHFGVITKTLRHAAPDLATLMLVTSLMLVLLSAGAHLLIGNEFKEVSSPGKAIHFYFLYLVTGDMPGLHKAMASPLEGNEQSQIEYVSRRLAYVLVPLLVSFVLLSFLLGIVSDSYVATLEQEEDERPNMLDEVVKMNRNRKRQRSAVRVLASATEGQRHHRHRRAPSDYQSAVGSAAPSSMGITRATCGSAQDVRLLIHVACVFLMEHNLSTPEQVRQCARTLRRDVSKWTPRGVDDVVTELDQALWAFTQRFAAADDESLIETVESEEIQLILGVVQVENMTWQLEDHLHEVLEMAADVQRMCDELTDTYFEGLSRFQRSFAWEDGPSGASAGPLDDLYAVTSVQGRSHSVSVPQLAHNTPAANNNRSHRGSVPGDSNSTRDAEDDDTALKAHSASARIIKTIFSGGPEKSDNDEKSRRVSTPGLSRENEETSRRSSRRVSRRSGRSRTPSEARASTAGAQSSVEKFVLPGHHKTGTRRTSEAAPVFQLSSDEPPSMAVPLSGYSQLVAYEAHPRPFTADAGSIPLATTPQQQKRSETMRQGRSSQRSYRHSSADVGLVPRMVSGDAASLMAHPPAHHRHSDTDAISRLRAEQELPGQPQVSGASSSASPHTSNSNVRLFEGSQGVRARSSRRRQGQRRSDLGPGAGPPMIQGYASPEGTSQGSYRHSIDTGDSSRNLRRMMVAQAAGNSYRYSDSGILGATGGGRTATTVGPRGNSPSVTAQQMRRSRDYRDRLEGGVSVPTLPSAELSVTGMHHTADLIDFPRPSSSSAAMHGSASMMAQPPSMLRLFDKKLSDVSERGSRNEDCVIEDMDRND